MTLTGGCHCGAVRYEIDGEPMHGGQALCHCTDCRRCAGAPMVGWAMYPEDALTVTQGSPREYASSDTGRRWFCETCGTGLFNFSFWSAWWQMSFVTATAFCLAMAFATADLSVGRRAPS